MRHDAQVTAAPFLDFDFHPDEDDVRVFAIPRSGLLRADAAMLVYEIRYGDIVLRHYAFRDHWFKVNVTTDLAGNLAETRSPEPDIPPFAVNCDIATPMRWHEGNAYAVDLFLDVLVRQDASSCQVRDRSEFTQALRGGLISAAEAEGARAGLAAFIRLIRGRRLMAFLGDAFPFGRPAAPAALPDRTVPLLEVAELQPGRRPTW
jgi:hypothetical protein